VIFVDGVKSTVAFPVCWVTWIASPETEAIIPLTQLLPFADADGDEGVAAELVGPADGAGFELFDAPHAATDSAVAPVSVRIANRVSRAGGEVIDIEILSDRRPLCAAGQTTALTIGGAAERWLAADYEPAVYSGSPRESSLERGFGKRHDVVVEGRDDAAQCGEVRKHVLSEESRGGDLALIEHFVVPRCGGQGRVRDVGLYQ